MIRVTAFRWVPPFAQGLVRDLRVRWALEEAGLPYETRLIGMEDRDSPEHRARQPFGQIPAYEQEDEAGGERLALFESGAIVLHIAEQSDALLPRDPARRARAIQWMFAALNSIEPHIWDYARSVLHSGEEWAKLHLPAAQALAEKRLDELAARLGEREWLDGDFTAGDLLMVSVLRILRGTDLESSRPALAAYRARGEARPAFQRALAAQLAPFAENAPAG